MQLHHGSRIRVSFQSASAELAHRARLCWECMSTACSMGQHQEEALKYQLHL